MASTKVAVVSGSNKGIGFAIVKGLCKKFNGIVYLTSRNETRGQNAIKELKDLGYTPYFHQLDIDSDDSVDAFRDYLKSKYGGIDLLVNNAAIAFPNNSSESVAVQAEKTVKTNYFSTLRVCNALFPLLRQNAQVVHVSSSSGHLSRIPSQNLRNKLSNPNLSVQELNQLMNQYISDAKAGNQEQNVWGNNSYVVSKVGVSALTRIQQREFNNETPNRNASVNSVHPGYVDTDMTNHKGVLTIDEGAEAPLYLSLEPHGLKGDYIWYDKQVIDWLAPSAPSNPTKRN